MLDFYSTEPEQLYVYNTVCVVCVHIYCTLTVTVQLSHKRIQQLQGVSQYFGHLEICNFSASGVPRIVILDNF